MSKIYSRPRIRVPKFFLTPNGNHNSRKQKIMIRIFIIVVIAFSTLKIVLNAISPIFDTICRDEAMSIATNISNKEATKVMEEHTYDELFTIEKDEKGNISMIKSNVYVINSIISDIAVKIQEEINNKENEKIKISIGSFTGSKLLSGKGPAIPLKISLIGNVETDLRSQFTSQGINQTLHRLYLQVNCEVSILTPYNSISQKISNQVLLAENVIVGGIPNTYYNIQGIEENELMEFVK